MCSCFYNECIGMFIVSVWTRNSSFKSHSVPCILVWYTYDMCLAQLSEDVQFPFHQGGPHQVDPAPLPTGHHS